MASNKFPMQEQEVLSIKPQGLYTYPNTISAVPQGAMREAVNVILSRPNVIEQRRGIAPFGTLLSDSIKSEYSYQNRILIQHGNQLAYDSDANGTWVNYSGTYTTPTNALVIRSFQANKNIYFLTGTGTQKLDQLAGTIQPAGAPAGLDGAGSTTGSGWFTSHTQVAYRIVFGYTDANNNLILGAPSQRIVVSNSTGGATNVSLTFTLPTGLTTSWQYQIYRSPMSVDLATEPNDECALVYTGNPTSGQLTAGTITVTDSIDDSLKNGFIYTASSQQGIAQANYQPPLATDVATFKGFAFYANITSKQQIDLTLVSVASPGLQVDDTVTIAGVTYTGKSSETIASGYFQVFTSGTPSQNITNTANSLVRVINRYTSNTLVYAYYQSGYSEFPGQILLSVRTVGSPSFTAASSRAGAFVPDIGTTIQSSSNEASPNELAIAKYQQPEACPVGQTIPVGSADKSILRIIALRDYVLVFKQDGVFQIVGTDIASFAAQEVDRTVILRGIETAVALNNKVYCFTNQTVISITFNEGGILKAQPIKKDLLQLSSPLYPDFDSISYAIAYESENQYILGTPTDPADTTVTQYWVYNYLTDTWTTWQFPYTMASGFVNPTDGRLYFGSSDAGSRYVYQERKNYDETDFADNDYPLTIVSASGKTIVVADSTNAVVGYTLSQDPSKSIITEVTDATHIKVDDDVTWVAGAATVYRPIDVSIEFVPESCGNPGLVKHFKECHAIFSTADFPSFELGFFTDFYDPINFSTLVPKTTTGWGNGAWGNFAWGSGAPVLQVIRGLVPLRQRRGHWLNVTINYSAALTNFALDGLVLYHQTMSQKSH